MRSTLSCALAILTLCAAGGATALAQDGEGGDGSTTPSYPQVENELSWSLPFVDTMAKGQPIPCGQAATKYEPEVACRIEAKITVSARIAHWVGLGSRTIASGVAGDMAEKYQDEGRTYFLKVPSGVKAKLHAKHVRALGVQVSGTITVPGQDKIVCGSDSDSNPPKTHPSCPLTMGSEKRLIWAGQDGEMLCWRFMPWGLATPAKWGKMCPRPMHV